MARGGIDEDTPAAESRQPEAGSLHYALAHPCPGVGGERLYTLLRPTACQGGEGHAVARGGLTKARRKPSADSRQLEADSREPKARSRKLKAGSRKPEAESRQPKADSRQPIADSRQPIADSRQPTADSRQRITHTSSYSNSDTLRLRFPATRAYCPGTSGWSS